MSQLSHAVVAEACLNPEPPRVPIPWEAYASAAGPALGASPPLPDVGPHSRMQLRVSAVCRWDGALGAASILYWIVSTPFRAAFR